MMSKSSTWLEPNTKRLLKEPRYTPPDQEEVPSLSEIKNPNVDDQDSDVEPPQIVVQKRKSTLNDSSETPIKIRKESEICDKMECKLNEPQTDCYIAYS